MELDILADYRCRVCLKVTENALYLQEIYSGSVEALSYMDVLMLCCNIKISLDDGKPKKICTVCMENARISYEFKICCERSNLILENEIYITSRYNSVEDIRHDVSFSDGSLSSDIKDLVSITKSTTELIDSYASTNCDNNLVEPPIRILLDDMKLKFGEHIEQNEKVDKKCYNDQSRQMYNKHIKEGNIPEMKKQQNTFKACVHKCSTCGRKFNNFRTFSAHIRLNHTDVGKCSYCDTILKDYTSFIAHTKEHHPDKYCKIISCDICGAVFTFQNLLQIHRETQHKILYECKHCDFRSRDTKGFQCHMRDEHGVIEMVDGKDFSKCGQRCTYCNYTTTGAIKFGKHMEVEHEDKKTIVCEKCGKKFFTRNQLLVHCNNGHRTDNKKVVCDICGMQFTKAENLKRHILIHTGERPYKCKLCPKAFTQYSTLEYHKSSHSEERNVKCDVCGKCFKTKNSLRSHGRRNHDRLLNYKCPVCDKAFFGQTDLNYHSIVHTGLKLFKCEVCKKGFGRRHHLKTHMVTHTGEKRHVCHVCGKGFSQAHCLRTHLLKCSTKDNKTIEEM